MKTKLQLDLVKIAPALVIETIWSKDPNAQWDIHDPALDPDDFEAWESEIRAQTIVSGELISGSAYLGGTWEKYGDHPSKSNPDISGYELQMTEGALIELAAEIKRNPQSDVTAVLLFQIDQALDFVKLKMRER